MARNVHTVFYGLDGKVSLELTGKIDGSSAAEVCYRIGLLGLRQCTLDFSRVEEIEVFGARVLARGLKALKHSGVRLEIEGLREPVGHTLCLGGVLEALI